MPPAPLLATTLEPASTVNEPPFSLANLILTSLALPLSLVPPSLVTVIVPGAYSVPSHLPVSLL